MAVFSTTLLGTLISHVFAWRYESTLPFTTKFANYVGKFCFDTVPEEVRTLPSDETSQKPVAGMFHVTVHGKVVEGQKSNKSTDGPPCWGRCQTQGHMYLMVFDDEFEHWKTARAVWNSITCEERFHLANYVLKVSPRLTAAPYRISRLIQVTEKVRPRFWYFAFVNCGATVLEPVSFELHARNVNRGFQAEFGIDMQQTVPLETCSAICFALVAFISCIMTRGTRVGTVRTRPLLFMLRMSALLSAAGCGWLTLHHTVYANDGMGLPAAGIFGDFCACMAKALLTALSLLVARGWALLHDPGTRFQRYGIVAVLIGIIAMTVGCEIHTVYFHDQSTNFFIYESWPGIFIMVLNLSLFLVSWFMMWDTYHKESAEEVRAFYRLIFSACGIFFVSLPVMCLLAQMLDPWVRRKYIERIEIGSRFIATLLLLVCLRPSQLDSMIVARMATSKTYAGNNDLRLAEEEMAEDEERLSLNSPNSSQEELEDGEWDGETHRSPAKSFDGI